MDIKLQTIHKGYDRKTCWVHTRGGIIPTNPQIVVVTMQQLEISGSDVFHELNDMRSDDGGRTWSGPTPYPRTLGRRAVESGIEEGISDFTPTWHARTRVLLGTGHTVRYKGPSLMPHPRRRNTAYSSYDPRSRTWSTWQNLAMPNDPKFFSQGAGSTQRFDLPNGDILLPSYYDLMETAQDVFYAQAVSTVLRCRFDGRTLSYLEHGSELTIKEGRGFSEPSITYAVGRFFLTLRNDLAGYVAVSRDGLHYSAPRPWTFDDGRDLGNYNTQQHWVTLGNEPYLVYTRRGANNDHILRHRAPLFIAQVDPDRLYVIRSTERILVPERGAALGNFGIARLSDHESWVFTSEWMQTGDPKTFYDCRKCELRGSDNSIFIAKVRQ